MLMRYLVAFALFASLAVAAPKKKDWEAGGYVGTEACLACHEDMGKAFLNACGTNPRVAQRGAGFVRELPLGASRKAEGGFDVLVVPYGRGGAVFAAPCAQDDAGNGAVCGLPQSARVPTERGAAGDGADAKQRAGLLDLPCGQAGAICV